MRLIRRSCNKYRALMTPEEAPATRQNIEDRKLEIERVAKRLAILVQEHVTAAQPLGIELSLADISAVIEALRDHARGGPGIPIPGARDAIHAHVLNRLFEELVEEPSNIFCAKSNANGKEPSGYDAMDASFWLECLDFMEASLSSID